MKMITAFEETFSDTDSQSNSSIKDYEQISKALQHDFNVAENIFSRNSKKELKRYLTEKLKHGFSMKSAAECRGLWPFWVTDNSVAVSVLELEHIGLILSSLVQNMGQGIVDQVKDSPLTLVDPLQTGISRVGVDVYLFRLKQKWTIGKSPTKEKP